MHIVCVNSACPMGHGEQIAGVGVVHNVGEKRAAYCVDIHTPTGISKLYPKAKRILATFESPLHLATWMCRDGPPPNPDDYAAVITNDLGMLRCPHAIRACIGEIWMRPRGTVGKRFGVGAMFSGKRGHHGYELRYQIACMESRITIPHEICHSYDSGDGNPWRQQHAHASKDRISDWMFQIAIENVRSPAYFTEKLLDCFATATVPIYWGDPDFAEEFDRRGVIVLDEPHWIDQLNSLQVSDYTSRLLYVRANYLLSQRYWSHSRSLVLALARAGIVDGAENNVDRCTHWSQIHPQFAGAPEPQWGDEIMQATVTETMVKAAPVVEPETAPVVQPAVAAETPAVAAETPAVVAETPAVVELVVETATKSNGKPEVRLEASAIEVVSPIRICTFAAHLGMGGDGREFQSLLEIWHYSWKQAGWDPHILTPWDLDWTEADAAIIRKWKSFPTRNARNYTMSTFSRWLAMAANDGGWMCDHDLINYGWKPKLPTDEITLYTPGCCPCLVSGSAAAFRAMAVRFSKRDPRGLSHISDQVCCQSIQPPRVPVVVEYRDAGWESAPLVHFSRKACGEESGGDRSQIVLTRRNPA